MLSNTLTSLTTICSLREEWSRWFVESQQSFVPFATSWWSWPSRWK
jgi:hypothetical protein